MDTYTTTSFNLFPYRTLPTASRIKIYLFETDSAIRFFEAAANQLRYFQDYSELEMPMTITALFQKLSHVGSDYRQALDDIDGQDDRENTLEMIETHTGNLLEQLATIVEEFQQEEPTLEDDEQELRDWFSNVEKNTQLIRAAVHTLIDQNNLLPDHLADWAMNRHELKKKAENKDQTILPSLLTALKNPESFVRREALKLFQFFDASIKLDPLISLLDDPSETVRQATADTLGKLGSDQAIAPLVNSLDTIGFPAATALFRLGDPHGQAYLFEQLQQNDGYQKQAVLRIFMDNLKQLWNDQHIQNAISDSDVALNRELAQKIVDRLKAFEPYFAPYWYELCNELRHYSGVISERKSMEYVNIILENNVMDHYTINILSDWYMDRGNEKHDSDKRIQVLLSRARTYSDLLFLEVACLIEAANALSGQGQISRARELFLEVLNRSNSHDINSMTEYQRVAWYRLRMLDRGSY